MSMTIFAASHQWSTRPADERFLSLEEMYAATRAYAQTSAEAVVKFDSLRAEAQNGEVVLVGKANTPATLTNWAFSQLSQRAGAPASYLSKLPATLAVQNINHGLKARQDGDGSETANLLMHQNGGMVCRALTTEVYQRVWNFEIIERLLRLAETGWTPAMPDTHTECLICNGTGYKAGTCTAEPSLEKCFACKGTGKATPDLYASDHDMFAFLRNKNNAIAEPGTDQPLYRGIIVRNSEVGDGAIKLSRFLYRYQCGNHMIWGAEKLIDLSVRHVGNTIQGKLAQWHLEVKRYSEESASDDEAKIAAARTKILGATKEQVLDALFSNRRLNVPRKVLDAGYDAVRPDQDGSPNTVWGIAQGLTRYSQTFTHADKRNEIDRAAGRILQIVF